MVAKYKRQFGTGLEALTYLGQNYFTVDRAMIPDILRLLRDEEHFDYCVDITAVRHLIGKANRLYPSTSFAGPPPRSGEDRRRPLSTPKRTPTHRVYCRAIS